MANKSFDDIIKSKLDHFHSEVDANAWDLFEQSQSNHAFDQEMINKVEGHQLEIFPQDWDLLAGKLDKVEVPNDFDALIGAKLSAVSLEETPDWDQFEQILEENEKFDQEVSSKVKNHTVPSTDQHWPKLSAHLEEVERRRNRIVITKFIEAAIFILFVLTIMQLYPIDNVKKDSPYRTFAVLQDLESNDGTRAEAFHEDEIEVSVNRNETITDVSSAALVNSSDTDQRALSNEGQSERLSVLSLSNSRNVASEDIEVKTTPRVAVISPLNIVNLSPSTLPLDKIAPDKFEKLVISNQSETKVLNSSQLLVSNNRIDFSVVNPMDLYVKAINFERGDIQLPYSDALSNVKKGQYWLNAYGAPEVNFINTPYDIHLGTDAYQNGAYGYSVGATVSYETNSWEVESGLAYSSLNYFPAPVTEQTGSAFNGITESTLKEIVMDIVEIPLNFKYKLFRKKGWAVYANSGISVGALASSDYIVEREFHPIFAAGARGNAPSGELRKKNFDPGLLNGGAINNNFFVSLNTGLGVSKKISDNMSFFVQPTYYHNMTVKGLGPNKDVHNRLSMQVGTKIRL